MHVLRRVNRPRAIVTEYRIQNTEFISNFQYTYVAVACGVRLSCSVFMVYSVLLSVSLVARAPI